MRDKRLLVVGFGPFPGMAANPSAAIARAVGASVRLRLTTGRPRVLVLRTAYAALDEALDPALTAGPSAALLIGVAGRARRIRVETRAKNRASRLMPDAGGRSAGRLTLDSAGPMLRPCGPVAARAAAILRRAGVPARLSPDAGRYLCNASYYRALARPFPVLFLHVPRAPRRAPVQPGGRKTARLGWTERLAAAFAEIAVTMAREGRPGAAGAGRRPA